jgi:hypothetical protein
VELANDRKKKLVYISVDTETSGPIPGDYSLLSIGACLVAQPATQFYVTLRPLPGAKVLPQAMAVNGLSIPELEQTGLSPFVAMLNFDNWVDTVAPPETAKPVFVGFNATFDWLFVHWYFWHFYGHDPFGISGMDIKAFAAGLHREGWESTYKRDLRTRYPTALPHTHNAVDDAVEQADLFRQLLAAHNMLLTVLAP